MRLKVKPSDLYLRQWIGASLVLLVICGSIVWKTAGSPVPDLPLIHENPIDVTVPVTRRVPPAGRPPVVILADRYLYQGKRALSRASAKVSHPVTGVTVICLPQQCAAVRTRQDKILFTNGTKAAQRIVKAVDRKFR